MKVPFFRPDIGEQEISEVEATLRSGWLTSGPRVRKFEENFAKAVGAPYAMALNSCTAALHLAVEALGLERDQAVLVPTMTFAATAEVVRYQGAVPILVDCDPGTLNLDLADAERKLEVVVSGALPGVQGGVSRPVGLIPVHVGGLMLDVEALQRFASRHNLWLVEDAAHAFPAAWRAKASDDWQHCGEGTAKVSCFSFYANKTITTGEGGMAVSDDVDVAARMRLMSLHGLSRDAWKRYAGGKSWDYRILAPGYKYNLTDIAAAMGIHQLARAEEMRLRREELAQHFLEKWVDIEEIELPPDPDDRIHAWHLFPIRLRLERLDIDRNEFIEELRRAGIGCSVHWRPLHLHPYYQETWGWTEDQFPVASQVWHRLVSLPLFSSMKEPEADYLVETLREVCRRHGKVRTSARGAAT